jgi:putative phage-type endonuclease
VKQNSEDWDAWRLKGLGASEAPIVMGISKYQTPKQLFNVKMGLEVYKPNEFITGLGHRFEPRALAYINLMEEADYEPTLCTHSQEEWIRCSLDGLYEGTPLEIKYVGAEKLEMAKHQVVQDITHWIQMQHQMMVTGSLRCIYLCYTLDKPRKEIDEVTYFSVDYDEEYALRELFPKLKEFWAKVQAREWSE